MKNLLEVAENFARQWTEISRQFDAFIEGARQVGDGVSLFPLAFVTTLAQGGWSAAPLDGMDADEAAQLVVRLQGKSDDEVKQDLDVALPAYFRKDDHAPLSEMVASWHLHFEDHRIWGYDDVLWAHHHQVFEDALWAHKKGRYTLSISALAPQFEGVGRDLMKEYRRNPSEWHASLKDRFNYEPNRPSKPHEVLPEFMDLPILDRFEKAPEKVEELNKHITMIRINELFKGGDFSKAKFTLSANRQGISHGVFRNFIEVESLKLFFVLDLLHKAVGMYRELAGPPPERVPTERT
ncbi:MAG: hypothetical protein H0U23_00615 [Blastocatellia bacterium]|nr:hypothetical protein [Blastocatellia bacterium]